jgi:hypothetical protein
MCPAVPRMTCFISQPYEEFFQELPKDNKKPSILQFDPIPSSYPMLGTDNT